ncbi:hypothetical protein [Erythrobacter sp. WG]|uniref:hypothetical protein n=1 Tax=Erythrobacter sp. WG TaxID=2985510 RepID=UPI00226F53D6|nr:hypothetical protein [Erythrobacter sp. WG]MCX9148037.1 hypothetical protein [Erythrobacter sp. WG]
MIPGWPDLKNAVRRKIARRTWIPILLSRSNDIGKYPHVGWRSSFEGVHSLVIHRSLSEKFGSYGWSNDYHHAPWASRQTYKPFDEYWESDESDSRLGFRLVSRQSLPDRDQVYHLHHDFIFALNLAYETGSWVRPCENYIEVAREIRDSQDRICGIEAKAEFLADYLSARNSILRISSFSSQQAVLRISDIPQEFQELEEEFEGGRLAIRRMDLDQTGDMAGAGVAVFRVARTDVDPEEDVPELGPETNENTSSESWSFTRGEAVAARLMADYWRDEIFEANNGSIRVRGDEVPSNVTFIVDASGQRMSADQLDNEDVGKWLWFKPDIIASLAERRGAELNWYSRFTGGISTPSDPAVHFGINSSGLVTVYANDVARLPEWERRLWGGYNVAPEGKVCAELLMSQVEVRPAETQSPEKWLPIVLDQVRDAWRQQFGTELFRKHDKYLEILSRCHRFRALNLDGLYALAKDVARISADLIDEKAVVAASKFPPKENLRSLKALQHAISELHDPDVVHQIFGPLFATYDLRLQDAHLPKSEIASRFKILDIDPNAPTIFGGEHLLYNVVTSFDAIRIILEQAP